MSAGTPAKSTRLTCVDLNCPSPLPTIDTVAPGTPVCGCNSIFGGAAPAGPLPAQTSIRLVAKSMIQFIRTRSHTPLASVLEPCSEGPAWHENPAHRFGKEQPG